MDIDLECRKCGDGPLAPMHTCIQPDCRNSQEHHEFRSGPASIHLTADQVDTFIAQGDDSMFDGNDLLYPIYEQLKKEVR